MISVIQFSSSKSSQEKSMNHVSQEVCFLCLTEITDTHMRKHLLLKNFLGILYSFFFRDSRSGSSDSNEIQGNILLLDNKCFVEGRFHDFHHLWIFKVIDNVFKDISVSDESKSSEDNHDWNLLLDVRNNCNDSLSNGCLLRPVTSSWQHVNPKSTRGSRRVFNTWSTLSFVGILWVFHGKDINSISCHLLLSNQYLLRAIDNKVSSRIKRTLVQFSQISVRQSWQQTVRRSQHDWNLANECLLMSSLLGILSISVDCLNDVNIKGSRVCQVSESGFIRHHWRGSTILFPMSGFRHVNLFKLQDITRRGFNFSWRMSGLCL